MKSKGTKYKHPLRFVMVFIVLFLGFYYFNIVFFGITSPGNHYNAFLADHLNYIRILRHLLLISSSQVLKWFGFTTLINDYELLVVGHGTIRLVYSCLGLGVISFFTAFVLAYPAEWRKKLLFIVLGFIAIELLNIIRFVLLALFWTRGAGEIIDHHTIFNIIIYIIVAISLYFWVKYNDSPKTNAAN